MNSTLIISDSDKTILLVGSLMSAGGLAVLCYYLLKEGCILAKSTGIKTTLVFGFATLFYAFNHFSIALFLIFKINLIIWIWLKLILGIITDILAVAALKNKGVFKTVNEHISTSDTALDAYQKTDKKFAEAIEKIHNLTKQTK